MLNYKNELKQCYEYQEYHNQKIKPNQPEHINTNFEQHMTLSKNKN